MILVGLFRATDIFRGVSACLSQAYNIGSSNGVTSAFEAKEETVAGRVAIGSSLQLLQAATAWGVRPRGEATVRGFDN